MANGIHPTTTRPHLTRPHLTRRHPPPSPTLRIHAARPPTTQPPVAHFRHRHRSGPQPELDHQRRRGPISSGATRAGPRTNHRRHIRHRQEPQRVLPVQPRPSHRVRVRPSHSSGVPRPMSATGSPVRTPQHRRTVTTTDRSRPRGPVSSGYPLSPPGVPNPARFARRLSRARVLPMTADPGCLQP